MKCFWPREVDVRSLAAAATLGSMDFYDHKVLRRDPTNPQTIAKDQPAMAPPIRMAKTAEE
eukprot:2193387-Amphidinium_carterae.1